MSPEYRRIYAVIRRIPRGKVSTYGAIAKRAKCAGPRQVGYALRILPAGEGVPWHRVVNSQGKISSRPGESDDIQRVLLEAEGVAFKARGRIDLRRHRWPRI